MTNVGVMHVIKEFSNTCVDLDSNKYVVSQNASGEIEINHMVFDAEGYRWLTDDSMVIPFEIAAILFPEVAKSIERGELRG